eukprot:EG_transcript_53448
MEPNYSAFRKFLTSRITALEVTWTAIGLYRISLLRRTVMLLRMRRWVLQMIRLRTAMLWRRMWAVVVVTQTRRWVRLKIWLRTTGQWRRLWVFKLNLMVTMGPLRLNNLPRRARQQIAEF